MDSLLEHRAARPAKHKLTADQYYAMAEAGVLHGNDRIELIGGEIVEMAPIGQDHGGAVTGLNQALVVACLGRALVLVQSSFRIDAENVPEPDFTVLRFRPDHYVTGAPAGPADALLVVEVARSSLDYDKEVKLPLYARACIPEYWIVNLKTKMVDVYRRPDGDTYADATTAKAGEVLPLLADPLIKVTLDIVFG